MIEALQHRDAADDALFEAHSHDTLTLTPETVDALRSALHDEIRALDQLRQLAFLPQQAHEYATRRLSLIALDQKIALRAHAEGWTDANT